MIVPTLPACVWSVHMQSHASHNRGSVFQLGIIFLSGGCPRRGHQFFDGGFKKNHKLQDGPMPPTMGNPEHCGERSLEFMYKCLV